MEFLIELGRVFSKEDKELYLKITQDIRRSLETLVFSGMITTEEFDNKTMELKITDDAAFKFFNQEEK